MKKKALVLLLVVGMIFSLISCGNNNNVATGNNGNNDNSDVSTPAKDDSKEKLTFMVPYQGDPGTADVAKTTDEYGLPLNLFERLVESETIAPGVSDLVPGLAESWEVTTDGLVYTFHIRENALFHNGEEVTAEDVAFTFDRMLDPATAGLNTDFFDMIVGAPARMEGTADNTAGLKVIDKYTLEITIDEPYAPFIAGLATPAGSVYSKSAVEAAGDQFGVDPALTIGSGPFQLEEWIVNDQIVMSSFQDYWRGAAQYDELVFKIVPDADTARMYFETGELDVFNLDFAKDQIPYFEGNATWKDNIISGPRIGVYYYAFNSSIPELSDARVRKAIQMSVDRQSILDTAYYGKGILVNSVIPPGLYGSNPEIQEIKFDPEAAKVLLAEAGYADGFDMIIAQTTNSPTSLTINQIVQANLKDVGINVTIEQTDGNAFYATRSTGTLPTYFSSWSADFNDPDNFVYTFFSTDNSKKRSFNYDNAGVQADIEAARIMTDADARIALYHEIENTIVHEDAAWLPLFELDHLFVVQDYVKNYKVAWNGWSDQSYYSIEIIK